MAGTSHHDRVRSPRWPHLIDGAIDGGVVAGALWTLWYSAGLIWQFDLRPSGWVFAVATLVCMVAGARRALGADAPHDGPTVDPTSDPTRATAASPDRPAVRGAVPWARPGLIVAALLMLIWMVSARTSSSVVLSALLVMVLIVFTTWPAIAGRGAVDALGALDADAPVRADAPGTLSHLVAVASSIGVGVLSLFVLKPDADDVYYVNRATWVAEHGTAALRDTMFGANTYPASYGGGLPTPSIEALQGVVAHMLGLEAPTVAYLVYTPIFAALFVWVTWRLVRAWAPRRHLLVLLLAVFFVLASGSSIIGGYSIGRIWQGKVTAYAVLVPLVWTYLTRAAERGSRTTTGMLFASGIVFVGLTTSSALMMPVIVGAGLLAAIVLRSRPLLIGALAFAVGPLVNGIVQVLGSTGIGGGATGDATDTSVFAIAFGSATAMAAIAMVATPLAPGALRRPAAAIAGAGGFATMATFVPGMIHLVDAATGAGPVVWRLVTVAPTWVFVGLLVAVPGSDALGRAVTAIPKQLAAGAAVVITAAVVIVSVTSSHWIWSPAAGAQLTSSPTWKVEQRALADVRAARTLDIPSGPWLMPPNQMQNLAISTTQHQAVVPRYFYLDGFKAPAQEITDRRNLYLLAAGQPVPAPAVANVRAALTRLDVSLACVRGSSHSARQILSSAVGAPLKRVGSMRCHVRSS